MNRADKLLLKNGFDLKGNKTGKRVEILNKRQKVKRRSKPYIKERKRSGCSPGEERVSQFLVANKVRYIREYYFATCYNKKGYLLFFDFYLPEYNAVIEYDGVHHFKPINGQAAFKQQKENDHKKNVYCFVRKIPILRIPCFQPDVEKVICEWFDKNF